MTVTTLTADPTIDDAPTVLQAPVDMPARPTREELFDALIDAGYTSEEITLIMDMFSTAALMKNPDGTYDFIWVTMKCHDLLERIMPDYATPAPGSMHERIDAHFLDEGETYLHDQHGHCSLQVVNRH